MKSLLAFLTFELSRFFMGAVLWACMIILVALGIQHMITPDPWYIQWWDAGRDFVVNILS